ncbi:hypothetical protein L0244_33775, partial [bacterium]|nr:hypothetical protein [bacterium]
WAPKAVIRELEEGQRKGFDVPKPNQYSWLEIVEPKILPTERLTMDLGAGELAAMALALENPSRILLLDDQLADARHKLQVLQFGAHSKFFLKQNRKA